MGKDGWTLMLDGYARCVRIVREIKEPLPLDIGKDSDPYTQALFKAYTVAQKAVGPSSTIDEFFTALTVGASEVTTSETAIVCGVLVAPVASTFMDPL